MHLTEIQLRQLADDRLSAEERKAAVRHLLTKCRPCLELARKILFPEMESELDYAGVLRRLDLSLLLAKNDVRGRAGHGPRALGRPVDAADLAHAALTVTDLLDPRAYGEECRPTAVSTKPSRVDLAE